MEGNLKANNMYTNITKIHKSDLPISCPIDNSNTWNNHPRVYLSFYNNLATCPYCSAKYILTSEN